MEWIQVITIIGANIAVLGVFVRMHTTLQKIMYDHMEFADKKHTQLRHEFQMEMKDLKNDMKDLRNDMHQELKDFHGRLIKIEEERNRQLTKT